MFRLCQYKYMNKQIKYMLKTFSFYITNKAPVKSIQGVVNGGVSCNLSSCDGGGTGAENYCPMIFRQVTHSYM